LANPSMVVFFFSPTVPTGVTHDRRHWPALATPILGAGKIKLVSQDTEQADLFVSFDTWIAAVYIQSGNVGHAGTLHSAYAMIANRIDQRGSGIKAGSHGWKPGVPAARLDGRDARP
jgi:hypothetical protein